MTFLVMVLMIMTFTTMIASIMKYMQMNSRKNFFSSLSGRTFVRTETFTGLILKIKIKHFLDIILKRHKETFS